MSELLTTQSLLAFLTLAALEIVLGVDNLVFIAILSGKLPKERQAAARRVGLALAAIGRLVLLFAITWVIMLEAVELFHMPDWWPHHGKGADAAEALSVTLKDLVLIVGGLFLLGKGTWEIHENLEGGGHHGPVDRTDPHHADTASAAKTASFGAVIGQIIALDAVFSIDSVLTAIGMVSPADYTQSGHFPGTEIPWPPLAIMAAAVCAAIVVMLSFVGPLSRFIQNHPTMKMLALSFLLLIGVVLVADGLGLHIPRGYIYFAMGFSVFVELLNLKLLSRRKRKGSEQPGARGQ